MVLIANTLLRRVGFGIWLSNTTEKFENSLKNLKTHEAQQSDVCYNILYIIYYILYIMLQGYHGYVTFTWVYGLFTGGYQYRLPNYKTFQLYYFRIGNFYHSFQLERVGSCNFCTNCTNPLHLFNYSFSLKMYVYQKVRARNFARAWGYIQVLNIS